MVHNKYISLGIAGYENHVILITLTKIELHWQVKLHVN